MEATLTILGLVLSFIFGYGVFRLLLWAAEKKLGAGKLSPLNISYLACIINMPVIFFAANHGAIIIPVPSYVAVYAYFDSDSLPVYFMAAFLSLLICVPLVNKKLKFNQNKHRKI